VAVEAEAQRVGDLPRLVDPAEPRRLHHAVEQREDRVEGPAGVEHVGRRRRVERERRRALRVDEADRVEPVALGGGPDAQPHLRARRGLEPEVDAARAQRGAQRPSAELPAQLDRELPRLDPHGVAGRSGFLRARRGAGQEEPESERETIDPLHGFTGSRTRTARPGK
jgi:hypothetical protein